MLSDMFFPYIQYPMPHLLTNITSRKTSNEKVDWRRIKLKKKQTKTEKGGGEHLEERLTF